MQVENMPIIIEKLLKIIELDEKIFKIYVDRMHTPKDTNRHRMWMHQHSLMEQDKGLRRKRKSIKLSLRGDLRRLKRRSKCKQENIR